MSLSTVHRVGAVQYAVLALVMLALTLAVADGLFWFGLASAAMLASKAVHALQMPRLSDNDPGFRLAGRAFKRLGQGFCVTAGLWLVSAARGEHVIGWFASPVFMLIGGTYWFMGRGAESGSTWFPFQSPRVREISAHLTDEEKARLAEHGRQNGLQLAPLLIVPLLIVSGSFLWSPFVGAVAGALFAVYAVAVVWPRMRVMRRRGKELLYESGWARERGYNQE